MVDTAVSHVKVVGVGGAGGGSKPLQQSLQQFLLGFRVEKGCDHTHTSFAKPAGSFYIPSCEHERFVRLYGAALANGDDLHLTEHHRHIGPIVVDLDFRFEPTADELLASLSLSSSAAPSSARSPPPPQRRYTPEMIAEIARIYGRAAAQLVVTPDQFDVYVMEKSAPTMHKGLVKDGVHLVVPDVVTRPEVQLMMRNAVLPLIAEVLRTIPGSANRVEDVVDEAVIQRNNWMMYGSKKPQGEPYVATRRLAFCCVTGTVNEVPLDGAQLADGVDLFSIRNKHDECAVRDDRAEVVRDFVVQQEERRKRRDAVQAVVSSSPNARANTCDDLERIGKLVDLLDVARTESYNEWVRVGWCLRNIDHRLLEKWVDFSKKSPKYVEGECPRLWQYMRQGGLGVGTLHMWARQDSPDRYRELLRLDLSELMLKSANGTHHDIARVVHHMYRYDYVCSSIRNRTWYEFRNHRWQESDSAYTLRKRMSVEVFREYGLLAMQMQARSVASSDDSEQKRILEVCQKLNSVALQLKKTNFKDNVIKECGELFMVEKFEDALDADCNLICFENGVYDLERFEFREGRPDDNISYSTGIDYIPYDDAHPIVRDIKRVLEQIHPSPDIRCYVLRTLAGCLSGHITSERFNIWTGSGSNGKSITVTLMEKAFGDYACKFPVTLLTQKRAASNAASGEIARAKGRRFGVLQEPSEDERLNIGLMKELSGGDKIQCRQLYKSPVEWKPQFKPFLLCNHLPSVPSEDGGTWRRIRVIEFGSKFVENPVRENEYPIDVELGQNLDSWKEHFMAMLIDYHRRHAHTKLDEPEAVVACTRDYQRNNDHMADFMDSCIMPAPEPSAMLQIDDVMSEYREWAKHENGAAAKNVKRREVQGYLDRSLARSVKAKGQASWRGYCLRSRNSAALALLEEDEPDDDDLDMGCKPTAVGGAR